MEKHPTVNKWRVGIAIVLLVLAAVMLAMGTYMQFFITTLKMSENNCEKLFGCTPQEFFELELELYDETRDFRKLAYVDKQGQLVLLLTQDQIDVWLPLLKQDVIDAERRNDNIDISDDCATITVSCYNETVYSDVQEAVDITHKMAIISFLNTGDYSYEFVIKDGLTDIIVLALSPLKEDSLEKINEVLDRNTFGSISEKNE
ncbi:MAG: hypothetical protein E7605_01350 [Ruminococcaceae bacterium]|nr:hypothetical protein [Oscillospiraceae bacterium]